jgi:signal transduction histidine kinase
VPSDLPSVTGYPFLLRQLFMNLIGNALKYRRTDTPPQVAIAWRPLDTGVLEITVADNGIGIPPEHRERVFGLFQRLHRREEYPGTGVGLALCKRIADEHGGTVALEETPGGGCTVRLTLHDVGSAAAPQPPEMDD